MSFRPSPGGNDTSSGPIRLSPLPAIGRLTWSDQANSSAAHERCLKTSKLPGPRRPSLKVHNSHPCRRTPTLTPMFMPPRLGDTIRKGGTSRVQNQNAPALAIASAMNQSRQSRHQPVLPNAAIHVSGRTQGSVVDLRRSARTGGTIALEHPMEPSIGGEQHSSAFAAVEVSGARKCNSVVNVI